MDVTEIENELTSDVRVEDLQRHRRRGDEDALHASTLEICEKFSTLVSALFWLHSHSFASKGERTRDSIIAVCSHPARSFQKGQV